MNQIQISKYLSSDEYTKQYFRGVMSFDKLPSCKPAPLGLYIVNTDISSGPGKHWVCILLGEVCEYFDSLGRPPKEVKLFIENQNKKYIFSTKQIQGYSSDVCGDYCVLFSYYRCRGKSMKSFLQMFTKDVKLNDKMVDLSE